MTGVRYRDLLNAFQPATEADDPDRFAGRGHQIRILARSLHTSSAVPVIYGDRGIGKTSLAVQMQRIAQGDIELLTQISSINLKFQEDESFVCIFYTCTDSTKDLEGLLQGLINQAEGIVAESSKEGEGRMELVDKSRKTKVSLKFVDQEWSKGFEAKTKRPSYVTLNKEEKLVELCYIISDLTSQPVLFIIDELDRMESTQGLAGFMKFATGEYLRFMPVGIASSISQLISDHQSLERLMQAVLLPKMVEPELVQIIDKAEVYLLEKNMPYQFSDEAKRRLSRQASGYPWFVHVLGQTSLVNAMEEGRFDISVDDITAATTSLMENHFAQQFSDMYQTAVRDSSKRELTLRVFAQWVDIDIPTKPTYDMLKLILDVQQPSQYKGHLSSPDYGEVIVSAPGRNQGLIRFPNEMFKAYVRLSPSLFQNVDRMVRDAYRQVYPNTPLGFEWELGRS